MFLLAFLIFLAFTFATLLGFSAATLAMGFVLAVVVLSLMPRFPSIRSIKINTGASFRQFLANHVAFAWDFAWDLTASNIQLFMDVWTPRHRHTPFLVYVPVDDLTNTELMLLSSRITLTPGTLSSDVTLDRKYLIVHVMYPGGKSASEFAAGLRRPIELLRRNLEP